MFYISLGCIPAILHYAAFASISVNSTCPCLIRQHEKFSSQLQLNQKRPPKGVASQSEVKAPEAAAAPVCEATTGKPPEASRTEDKTTGEHPRTRCTVSGYNTAWTYEWHRVDLSFTGHSFVNVDHNLQLQESLHNFTSVRQLTFKCVLQQYNRLVFGD